MEEGAVSRGAVIENNLRRNFAGEDMPDDKPGGTGADEVVAGGGGLEENGEGFEREKLGAGFICDVIGNNLV